MAKVRVAVLGSIGKSILIDPDLEPRVRAIEAALATAPAAGRHSALTGLQIGDDHPQYAMWQAAESITGLWNFATEPKVEGDLLTEFIQDVIGAGTVANSTSVAWTYNDVANTLSAATINANPTGTIGLAAVNGTAATPMRSDAAPALSQAITPTWTNVHTFSQVPVVPNDSWAYAKIQNVSATNRVLGRITAGAGDIEELTGANLTTIIGGAALTKVDDTNVTLTLGGTPATALLRASSLTLGWTGTLAVARGGTGQSALSALTANPTASVGLAAVNGSASTFMRSDGAPALSQAIAPTWTGNHTFTPAAGNTTFHAGNVHLDLDNQELKLGASQDFRMYHDGTDCILRADTGQLNFLIGSGIASTMANGSFTVRTVTARPSNGLISIIDPSGSKGYFGYDASNNFDIWNFLNGALTFGSNNLTRMQFPAAGGLLLAQQTVAATATAGAAALPATPQEFLTVTINGNVRKIPLYLN